MIDRVAAALRPLVTQLIVVSNDPAAESWLPNASTCADDGPERGSLVGIRTALRAAGDEDALVVAWDMPFVDTRLLAALAARLSRSEYAAVARSRSGWEATCAAYRPACLPVADRLIGHGSMRLSTFIAALPEHATMTADEVARIGDPERLFFNINTPDDLARAAALLGTSP